MKHLLLVIFMTCALLLSSCHGYDIVTNSTCVPPTPVNPDNLALRIAQGKRATRFDIALPSGFHGTNRCVTISSIEGPFNATVYGTESNILLLGNPQYSLHFQLLQENLKYTVFYTVSNSLFYSSTVFVNSSGTTDLYYNGQIETVTALVGEAPLVRL